MANTSAFGRVILDTFTGAIDVATLVGKASGDFFRIHSIEWQTPTTADHTALVSDGTNPLFEETCVTVKQSIIKYYNGLVVPNITVATSGVGSGKIIIVFE